MVEIFFEEINEVPGVNPEFLFAWFCNVCELENKQLGDLTIVFCSDEFLLGVNKQYLNHDYYTDIITFDYSEGGVVSGDLFISVDRVSENAADFGVVFQDELHRVCVHGVLHLCGYKDKTPEDENQMRKKEDQMLDLRKFHVEHLSR